MVGLGEETDELLQVFRDLASRRKSDMLTIGQYLRPSKDHLPMARYYHAQTNFAFMKEGGAEDGLPPRGIRSAGALVSYHAHEQANSSGVTMLM